MKILYKLLLIVIFLAIQSCAKDTKEINQIKELNQEQEMISTYNEALEYIDRGDSFYAAKKFLEAELLFPQSDWAPKSSLMAAYSYYSQSYYSDAIFELERYMKVYPTHPRQDYANYLLALCYYETIVDEKKDLEPLNKAKEKFEYVINEFPDSDFALDSKFKIDLVLDILAAKEVYIGKHYLKNQKWIAAMNRFKYVIENYQTTSHVEEALYRLVEINYKLGLLEESKRYASVLGYNYKSSKWYEESYRILNPKYVSRIEKIEKEKKRSKNFLIRKFRSLFD